MEVGRVRRFGTLASAAAALLLGVAACSDGETTLTNGSGQAPDRGNAGTDEAANTANGDGPSAVTAEEMFQKTIHPALTQTCAGCHTAGPAPMWLAQDVEKSYALMFQRGYVTRNSSLLTKGVHNGGGAPGLDGAVAVNVGAWIDLELKERGDNAPPSVLAKLADCVDKAKFDAIGFQTLQTVTRTAQNNPTKQAENANTCTGCKPTTCATCHSADPATGFVMAVGNTIFGKDHTFEESKSTSPPYIQKYFGLDPNGTPIASNAIKLKSDATVQAKAYSHPMFTLTPKMQGQGIDAYVTDAVTKYAAGTCGK